MNSTTTEILKRFRNLNVDDIRFVVEHGKKKQYVRSDKIETFLLAEIEAARRQAISEEREKIIIDALNSLKPTEEKEILYGGSRGGGKICFCHCHNRENHFGGLNACACSVRECQHCRKEE